MEAMENDTRELDPDIEYSDNDVHLLVPEFVKHAHYTIFFDTKFPDYDKTIQHLQHMIHTKTFYLFPKAVVHDTECHPGISGMPTPMQRVKWKHVWLEPGFALHKMATA